MLTLFSLYAAIGIAVVGELRAAGRVIPPWRGLFVAATWPVAVAANIYLKRKGL